MVALLSDIFFHDFRVGLIAHCPDVSSVAPKFSSPQLFPDFRMRLEHLSGANAFQNLHDSRRCVSWRRSDKQVCTWFPSVPISSISNQYLLHISWIICFKLLMYCIYLILTTFSCILRTLPCGSVFCRLQGWQILFSCIYSNIFPAAASCGVLLLFVIKSYFPQLHKELLKKRINGLRKIQNTA